MVGDPATGRGYLAVLRLPRAARFSAAGALARLPQGMLGLGSVLMVTGLGRSYTLGGLIAGAIALAQGVVSPQLSRLVDRVGQSRVLRPQLAVHAVALTALIVAGQAGAAGWLLVTAGAAVGASQPQIGAYARARWTALLAGDPRIDTGLAIESLIEEAVFVVGPVLVTALAIAIAPAAGLWAALALVVIGCVLFVVQRSTEPPPHPGSEGRTDGRAIRRPGLLVLVAVFLGIGALFGLVEVGVVARTRELGEPGSAGALLALWAGASLLSGTWYGSRRWHSPGQRRFQLGMAGMAVGTAMIAASAGSLVMLTVALMIAGVANAPTLITGNTLVPAVGSGIRGHRGVHLARGRRVRRRRHRVTGRRGPGGSRRRPSRSVGFHHPGGAGIGGGCRWSAGAQPPPFSYRGLICSYAASQCPHVGPKGHDPNLVAV